MNDKHIPRNPSRSKRIASLTMATFLGLVPTAHLLAQADPDPLAADARAPMNAVTTKEPATKERAAKEPATKAKATSTEAASRVDDSKKEPTQRRREGDVYQAVGRFEVTGDRITFFADGESESLRVLENLALERIAKLVEDPSGLGAGRKWTVSGTVTEYRGTNHLLLQRSILKAQEPAIRAGSIGAPTTTE